MGILDRIKEIEEEIARTQKNKATEHHIGMLKARLAKLRSQLLENSVNTKSGSGKGEGFEIAKSGDARVCILGFPSVGKSTFLTKVTETESVSSEIDFTTLTCIAGVLKYKGAR
jgi:ribosome-interacting GTPase 1